jgi:hypothetical protein
VSRAIHIWTARRLPGVVIPAGADQRVPEVRGGRAGHRGPGVLRRRRSHHHPAGQTIAVLRGAGPFCPVRLLREWLDAAGIIEGALFRQVPKGGKRIGGRLGGRAYYDVIKQRIGCIGLDASKFGSHSMRSGWISTAARNGASVWKMKEISRHKSTDVLAGYIREAELFQQHASVGMY